MQSYLKIALQSVLSCMSLQTRAEKIIQRLSFKNITANFPLAQYHQRGKLQFALQGTSDYYQADSLMA